MTIKFLSFAALLSVVACSTPETTTQPGEAASEATSSAAPSIPQLAMPEKPSGLPEIASTLSAETAGTLGFPTRHAYDFSVVLTDYQSAEEMTGIGHLYLPENVEGPVPAMIILHGSGGIKPGREHEYGELFAANGIAGFVVDYYSPRGATEDTPYFMKTMIASETDVLVDAYEALNFLAGHPGIDAQRVGVTGYSYGGMATRYALDDRVAKILSPQGNRFAAHADFYGPCHQVTGHSGTTGAAYLAVFGSQDDSIDPAVCETVHAEIEAAGSPTEVHIIEGAGHAWENDQPREEIPNPYIRGCTFSFATDTGHFLLDGELLPYAEPGSSLSERMSIRAQLGAQVGNCLGQGYIVGRDDDADAEAKSILLRFLREHL